MHHEQIHTHTTDVEFSNKTKTVLLSVIFQPLLSSLALFTDPFCLSCLSPIQIFPLYVLPSIRRPSMTFFYPPLPRPLRFIENYRSRI